MERAGGKSPQSPPRSDKKGGREYQQKKRRFKLKLKTWEIHINCNEDLTHVTTARSPVLLTTITDVRTASDTLCRTSAAVPGLLSRLVNFRTSDIVPGRLAV